MADTSSFTVNITDGSTVVSDVVESTEFTANLVTGAKGDTGDTGPGVPTGGTIGQVLAKASATDHDTVWQTPAADSVTSVNAQTGVVSLDQDDIADGTTYKQYSATEKTKLSGIATGATANDTDANLKARANHTGTQLASTISDFSTAADARISAAAGVSVASLSGGKVPSSQLPALSLTTVQTAASQAAQLALTTQEGDVVVRTDENKTYMKNAGTSGTMSDYTLLNTPTDAVTSVNSQTGIISLTQDDIGDGATYKQYSSTEKTKLAGIATGATANSTDATLLARANHTGTQTASTISDFSTAADARVTAIAKREARYVVTRDSSRPADYVCDGTADDVQIQAAIDAANAAGGGTVVLLAGTNAYRIAATITLPENVSLVGERMARQSAGGTILKTAASTTLTSMFTMTGSSNPASNAALKHDVHIENITFEGNNTTTNAFMLTNQDTIKFINCRFITSTNSINTTWDHTTAPTASNIPGGIYLERCNISTTGTGIGVTLNYQTQCWISNCWFTASSGTPTAWIKFNCSNKIKVTNCEFNTATNALWFTDLASTALAYPCHNLNISGCAFANGTGVINDDRTHASSGYVQINGSMASGTTAGDTLVGSGNSAILGTTNYVSGDLTVPDEAYDATAWDGSLEVPTKNAVRDKFESLSSSGGEINYGTLMDLAPNNTSYNVTAAGSAGVSAGRTYVVRSQTTASSYVTVDNTTSTDPVVAQNMNLWAMDFRASTTMTNSAQSTDGMIVWGVGGASVTATTWSPFRFVGFKIDRVAGVDNWYAVASNGTATTTTALTAPSSPFDKHWVLSIKKTIAGGVAYYLNRQLVATITTNVPNASTTYHQSSPMYVYVSNKTTTTNHQITMYGHTCFVIG